jgi:hypothetical protein
MLDDAFWNFACDIKRHELNLIDNFTHSARIFITELEGADHVQRTTFKDLRYDNLLKIKFYLTSLKTQQARSIHDKILIKLLKFEKAPSLKITKNFDEFLKGITYFTSQTPPDKLPAYHRLSSCGSGTEAFRKTYNQCHISMKKSKILKVKKQIETCYIERLIYDDLYKKQTLFFPDKGNASPSQDAGHTNWLEQTKKDFHTCFPDVEIKVSIEEFKDLMPLTLRISKKKGNHTIEEVYKRTLNNNTEYDPILVGHMYKANHLIKIKVQTFIKQNKWELP